MELSMTYESIDIRNFRDAYFENLNSYLLDGKKKISSSRIPNFGIDDGEYNIEELSKIFTPTYETHEVIICKLQNCSIGPRPEGFPRYWPILFKNRYLWNFINNSAKDALVDQGVITLNDNKIEIVENQKSIKICGSCVWLHLFENLDHLYRESLPAISAIKEIYGSLDGFTFVTPYMSEVYIEILELIGINRKDIVQTGNCWLEFESLIITSFPSFGHLHTPSIYYTKICDELIKSVSSSPAIQKPKKIFVSRKNAKVRRLENEGCLYDYLAENEYFICDPGDYTIEQQISLFSEAEIVVGSHGMGINNVVFSKKIKYLIEIMPTTWNRVSYFRTTQLRDSNYACYWIKPNENNMLCINKEKFITFLEQTLSSPSPTKI